MREVMNVLTSFVLDAFLHRECGVKSLDSQFDLDFAGGNINKQSSTPFVPAQQRQLDVLR